MSFEIFHLGGIFWSLSALPSHPPKKRKEQLSIVMSSVLLKSEVSEGGFATSLSIYKCLAEAQNSKDNFLKLCLLVYSVEDEKSEGSLLFSSVSPFLISQEMYMIFSLSLEVSTLLVYALACICLFAIISTDIW